MTSPAERIRQRTRELGFDAVGFAKVAPLEAAGHYEAWIAAGMHGGMDWLAGDEPRARRADPSRILADVRTVVCVAICHEPGGDAERDARLGRIARYAAGDDYHAVMGERLPQLQRFVESQAAPGSRALWYADTGAILERGWAERAGLGWTGKHSGLLSSEIGSWFLLGELLVDRDLGEEPAPRAADRCGTCTRCLDVCPTRAIVAPYRVDARLCISYLTIEHRGPIPRELRPAMGDWIFGCDLCQEVCPWNRFAPASREARFAARPLAGWTLERFLALDDAAFAALFAGSPIRRTGRAGFLRNVCVAIGNRGDSGAIAPLLDTLRGDPDWLVRGHAAWALGTLAARKPGGANAATAETTLAPKPATEPGGANAAVAAALREARAFDASPSVREEADVALKSLA